MANNNNDNDNNDNNDKPLVVVSRYHPGELAWENNNNGQQQQPILSVEDQRNDSWDEYNHPRYRRVLILTELAQRTFLKGNGTRLAYFMTPPLPADDQQQTKQHKQQKQDPSNNNLHAYLRVHSPDLIDFLETSWKRWDELKDVGGQDPNSSIPVKTGNGDGDGSLGDREVSSPSSSPPLIPGNTVLHRDSCQRPSNNVMGQIGYYCTDTCTPILAELLDELLSDQQVIQIAVRQAVSLSSSSSPPVVYALTTHPGHHAARDSFGGYCYVNHAALAARLLQEQLSEQKMKKEESSNDEDDEQQRRQQQPRVAVLDVDYHCGNGTASIFYDDASVVVISIHCHPDHEYPFHSGFEDERGGDSTSSGATLHLPLLPGANWTEHYQPALQKALDYLFDDDNNGDNDNSLGPIEGLVVSLGLDTLKGDPCAIRRAGFQLTTSPEASEDSHYLSMGKMIGEATTRRKNQSQQQQLDGTSATVAGAGIPCIVVQEGGYKMDEVPTAAADVLTGIVEARNT